MSISVYKSDNFPMGHKFITRKNRKPVEKARRLLFGRVNPEDEKKFIHSELEKDFSKFATKWNFDLRDEKTLDPDGDFMWAPPSPVHVARKRKPQEVPDDSSAYYFSPTEVTGGSSLSCLFQPIDPAARSESPSKAKTQRLITDYMMKSKRQALTTKDMSVERPKKIPRLGDFCSS